ncbi:MAG: tetratricopeptide repeat protein [Promethearchaeota archaeon]
MKIKCPSCGKKVSFDLEMCSHCYCFLDKAKIKYKERVIDTKQKRNAHSKKINELFFQANSLGNSGQYQESIEIYNNILIIEPTFANAWIGKGMALDELGRFEEAITCFQESLKINMNNAHAWANMGRSFANIGNIRRSFDCYERAIKLDPNDFTIWYDKAAIFAKNGMIRDAMKCYEEVVKINPSYSDAWFYLGMTLAQLGRLRDAIKNIDEALRINPNNEKARQNRAVIMEELKKFGVKKAYIDKTDDIIQVRILDSSKEAMVDAREAISKEMTKGIKKSDLFGPLFNDKDNSEDDQN